VVVGIDPGWRADDVVRVAAREAARRGAPLAVVAVARRSGDTSHNVEGLRADDGWSEAVARRALADAYDALGQETQRVRTTTSCLWKDEVTPAKHPLSAAELLVVGTRGRHGRLAFGLTSVSRLLLKSVQCSVLAVPPGYHDDGSRRGAVVAGIGDHPWDRAVLRTAVDEAERRALDLEVLHAYVPRYDETLTRGLRRAEDRVAEATEGLDPGPGTTVSVLLTQDAPASALLQESGHASLVVIGSRPGALSGLVLDSVSRAVLEAAGCPVLVVQRGAPMPDESAATSPADAAVDRAAGDPSATGQRSAGVSP
jgi:nucleotide-binding universal stress UspA family protein